MSFELESPIDPERFNAWIGALLAEKGQDLLRTKGILNYAGDGASIYECRSETEVIDLVRGGQGVFGIAVGSVWREVEGSLSELPGESSDGHHITPEGLVDELAARRTRRTG